MKTISQIKALEKRIQERCAVRQIKKVEILKEEGKTVQIVPWAENRARRRQKVPRGANGKG